MLKLHKKIFIHLILSVNYFLLIISITYLDAHSPLFHRFYQEVFYPHCAQFLRYVFGWIPFSIGDLLYLSLVLYLAIRFAFFCYHLIKKKYTFKWESLAKALSYTLLIYFIFQLFWGLNYQKERLSDLFKLPKKNINSSELNALALLMVQNANESFPQWKNENSRENITSITQKAFQLYQHTAIKNPLFTYKNLSFKTSLYSKLITKMGIMGYYQPFTAEGTINANIPKVDLPFTICHEMAHQLGIAYEDEAHLMAVYMIRSNQNPYFEFSMYINMLDYLLPELYADNPKVYKLIKNKLHPEILELLKQRQDYWKKQTGFLTKVSTVFYDQFLKMNQQEKGIHSYQDITIWLYQIYFPS